MTPIVQPDAASRLNVIGVPGEGKTVFRAWFQSRIYRQTLWNPMADYSIGSRMTVDDYRERIGFFRRGSLRVTVEPTQFDERGMADEFDELCGLVEEVGAQHFAVEEIALVTTPNRVPGNFNKLCIKGRHRGISMSIYGQRFHQFPLIVRGTASEIIAFRQTDPDDVKDFERRIAPSIPPVPLNQLPKHHFIRWTPGNGAVLHSPLPYRAEYERRELEPSLSEATVIG